MKNKNLINNKRNKEFCQKRLSSWLQNIENVITLLRKFLPNALIIFFEDGNKIEKEQNFNFLIKYGEIKENKFMIIRFNKRKCLFTMLNSSKDNYALKFEEAMNDRVKWICAKKIRRESN